MVQAEYHLEAGAQETCASLDGDPSSYLDVTIHVIAKQRDVRANEGQPDIHGKVTVQLSAARED